MVIFVFFLFARALFGLFGAASNPATQAYVAEHTGPGEPHPVDVEPGRRLWPRHRDRALHRPALRPALRRAGGSDAGLAPCWRGAMLFVVWRFLPESQHMPQLKAEPAKDAKGGERDQGEAHVARPARHALPDIRFIVAVCQTAQGQTLGFLIIDKLDLSPLKAQGFIAIAMMFGAMAGLLAQWGIIRMFEMTPRQLLRWGVAVAALGNIIVAVPADLQRGGGGLRHLQPGLWPGPSGLHRRVVAGGGDA